MGLKQCLEIKYAPLGGSLSLENHEAHPDMIHAPHLQQVLSPGWRQEGGIHDLGSCLWAALWNEVAEKNSPDFLSDLAL